MKVWIDTGTGTYGTLDEDENPLMVVDLKELADNDGEDTDETSYLAFLEGATDAERAAFALNCGRVVYA